MAGEQEQPETLTGGSQGRDIPAITVSPDASLRLHAAIAPPLALGDLGSLARFRVIRCLGAGGMGVVLLCLDPEQPESSPTAQVAAKVLRLELRDSAAARHRFLTEARHMSRLNHPNILSIVEIFPDHDPAFYTMPFIPRGSLGRAIVPEQPFTRERILKLAIATASAVRCAHDRGIIHRDLKPANILLAEDDWPLVCDFGLVRTVYNDSLVDPSRSVHEGSAPYMSPAIADGLAEDTRCDIYAFGATLHELLTTRPPYDGITPAEVMRKIRAGPPVPILSLQPGACGSLAAIAERCMARHHRDRYASMADVLQDLEAVRDGSHRLLRRRYSRRQVLLGAVGAAGAMGVGGLWAAGPWLNSARSTLELKPVVLGEVNPVPAGGGHLLQCVFSQDSKYLLAGGSGGRLELFTVEPFELVRRYTGLAADAVVYHVDINTEASRVISGSDQDAENVRMFDLTTGESVIAWSRHGMGVAAVSFSSGGRFFFTSSSEDQGKFAGVVYTTADLLPSYEVNIPINEVRGVRSFSRANRFGLRFVGGDGVLYHYHPAGELRPVVASRGLDLTMVNLDGGGGIATPYTASSDGKIQLWENELLARSFSGHDAVPNPDDPADVRPVRQLYPGGQRTLISGGMDRTIRHWDLATGALRSVMRFDWGDYLYANFSADGRMAAVTTRFNGVRLIRLPEPV